MLFIALFKVKAGSEEERAGRRLKWQVPEGINVVAEYWLQTPDPEAITIFKSDSFASMMQYSSAWSDLYDINMIPATTAEEGLEIVKQMME